MTQRKTLKLVGFYREMEHAPNDGPSMADVRHDSELPEEGRLAGYLREGQPFIDSPGVVFDALDGSGPVGTGGVLTDGEWAWPDDLAYHVEKYHLALPSEFVASVTGNDYHPPSLTIADLRTLTLP